MIILMFHPAQFAHPVSFDLGTRTVESLDCEISENINLYMCQMFIIKSMLRSNKIYVFFSIFRCETVFLTYMWLVPYAFVQAKIDR